MGKAKNKVASAGSRITGFSTPIFGLSWDSGVSDAGVARSVVAFMEDRRVLYNPIYIEDGPACVRSVLEIRGELTKAIAAGGVNAEMTSQFKEMRAACRKFCDQMELGDSGEPELVVEMFIRNRGDGKGWVETFRDFQLNQRLGELRAAIGERLAAIATKYDIDVEDQLRSIFPYPPD